MSEKKDKIYQEKKNGVVASLPSAQYQWEFSYYAKDNFWTPDLPTTASSAFLKDFFPSQAATVIELLKKNGYQLVGKTVLDEFACGGTGLHAVTGPVVNPHNPLHVAGGSSSGSAVVVAKKIVPFALGHDTGDSVRRPAAYCGVVGFKPSYGLISRYGVIPMASSLDTVGILADKISTVKKIFPLLAQKDPYDLLTTTKKPKTLLPNKKKIAIIAGLEKDLQVELAELYRNTQDKLIKLEYSVTEINIPQQLRENLLVTYLILCSAELISHLNSLQGITYGVKDSLSIKKKRSEYLGEIVKERLLIGAYCLEEKGSLAKAQKMRNLISRWLEKVFRDYDFLIFPSTSSVAPPITNFHTRFAGLISSHWSDNLLLLANFAGLPSLSLPIGFSGGLPFGISINSAAGQDQTVLELASELESE
jgi:aspartyl-tRNA(Asn)/glutamyl-tRNA(Gln) amidotransferase subunit A